MNPPEYELRLRAVKGSWPSPDVRRLAILLKRLGRNYGFTCTSVRELRTTEQKDKQK
jgi:hypothetical protein